MSREVENGAASSPSASARGGHRDRGTGVGPKARILAASAIALGLGVVGIGIRLWMSDGGEGALRRAERAMARGELAEASRALRPLLERVPAGEPDPIRDRAAILQARLALAWNNPGGAVAPLNLIREGSPSAVEADFWRAETLRRLGRWPEALRGFRKVAEARPEDAENWKRLASVAYDLGARDLAEEGLETLTRLAKDDAAAWRALGALRQEYGRTAEALAPLRASLAIDPNQPGARWDLARALFEEGAIAEAEEQLEAIGKSNPNDPESPAEADLWYERARIRKARGDLPGLRDALDRGLEANPDHAGLLVERATLDQRDGDLESARARLDRAAELDPTRPQIQQQRGLVARAMGDEAAAAAAMARAAELNEGLRRLTDLNERAASAPEDAAIKREIARVHRDLGMIELARSWYLAAIACEPSDPSARIELERLSETRGAERPNSAPGSRFGDGFSKKRLDFLQNTQ